MKLYKPVDCTTNPRCGSEVIEPGVWLGAGETMCVGVGWSVGKGGVTSLLERRVSPPHPPTHFAAWSSRPCPTQATPITWTPPSPPRSRQAAAGWPPTGHGGWQGWLGFRSCSSSPCSFPLLDLQASRLQGTPPLRLYTPPSFPTPPPPLPCPNPHPRLQALRPGCRPAGGEHRRGGAEAGPWQGELCCAVLLLAAPSCAGCAALLGTGLLGPQLGWQSG